jgi:hypothetical protein
VWGEFVEDQRECEHQPLPLEASVGGEDRSMTSAGGRLLDELLVGPQLAYSSRCCSSATGIPWVSTRWLNLSHLHRSAFGFRPPM